MQNFEQPESKIEAPETRRYEYKDANGKVVALVEATYEATKESVPAPWDREVLIPVSKLTAWTIAHPETGEALDMLAEFIPSGELDLQPPTAVFVPETRTKNYSFDFMSDTVIVPPPASAVDMANILHEFGHVRQFKDKAYDSLVAGAPIANTFLADKPVDKAFAVNQLDYVLKALPEVVPYVSEAAVTRLHQASTPDEVKEAVLELKDILSLPSRMVERDANRRALQAFMKIRDKIGVDLLKDTINPPEALMSGAEGCARASAEVLSPGDRSDLVIAATPEQLRKDLSSYGAVKFRIGRERGGGIMPKV